MWEAWVGGLDEDDWRETYLAPRKLAISARLRMVQINYFHMTYLTLRRWRYMKSGTSVKCMRCGQLGAHLLHVAWECPKVRPFREGVGREVSAVLGHLIDLTVKVAILGLVEELAGAQLERSFIGLACRVAKLDIVQQWKSPEMPTATKWRTGMDRCSQIKKTIYEQRLRVLGNIDTALGSACRIKATHSHA
ncbi:hypothetical protein NDU88_009892 [Pleurodeles waltl]|uniref:Reverse transcriptase n=1 Tax=Pleurodeles waltl TaxID=8319 RepID=A0AAV7PWA2_PLEWA|nr:hypothetical protein NDU88_009892 [Pleurodeles waltl]